MKKILIILTLFVLTIFVKAEYDSTYVLACKQKFAIPEDVENGDYVGYFDKNLTWVDVGTISYAIETNFYDAFAINSSTGYITINDATHIDGKIVQQDTVINIIIRTTDSDVGYELDTAQIRVKENSYCVFIDADAGGGGDGSRATPYDEISDYSLTVGYGYFYKKGNVFSNAYETVQTFRGTETNPTIIGSYGTGAKPAFVGTVGGNSYRYLIGGTSTLSSDSCSYIQLHQLMIRNYNSAGMYIWHSNHLELHGCNFYNNDKTAGTSNLLINGEYPDGISINDSVWIYDITIQNCVFDTSGTSNLKIGTTANIINCYFGESTTNNLRLTSGTNGVVKHCWFDNSNNSGYYGIQLRTKNQTILDNRVYNGYYGIYMSPPGNYAVETPDSALIKNNYFKGQLTTGMRASTSTDYDGNDDHIIEDNRFEDQAMDIELRATYRAVIRYNTFTDGSSYAVTNNWHSRTYDWDIYYNVIYGHSTGILINAGTGAEIYNNTVVGIINCTGASSETARNNYATAFTSIATESDNIDIDTITTADHFEDYAGHDYRLADSSVYAVDNGYYWGQTETFYGDTLSGSTWDIGADEFQFWTAEGYPIYSYDTIHSWQRSYHSQSLYDEIGWSEDCADSNIFIPNGQYIVFEDIDFTSLSENRVDIYAAPSHITSEITLLLDSEVGTEIGSAQFEDTGCELITMNVSNISGVHDLYVQITSGVSTSVYFYYLVFYSVGYDYPTYWESPNNWNIFENRRIIKSE